jgi:hypothetical protein
VTEVLDLGAVFDRDTVRMPDGTTYELRNAQEFGVLDDHRLRMLLKKIEELKSRAKSGGQSSEKDAEEASKLLRDLATMLVVELQTEIPDWACVAIFQFWVNRAQGETPAGDTPGPPRSRRTTVASSRGSKRSTAATRKPGSKKSPRGR